MPKQPHSSLCLGDAWTALSMNGAIDSDSDRLTELTADAKLNSAAWTRTWTWDRTSVESINGRINES